MDQPKPHVKGGGSQEFIHGNPRRDMEQRNGNPELPRRIAFTEIDGGISIDPRSSSPGTTGGAQRERACNEHSMSRQWSFGVLVVHWKDCANATVFKDR
ncbi:hypothetical protein NUU61_000517 [Penicillium alfredii]|uniref:Uncharacterized protein n=1 Tax=Penicillium alfredii TaxID=1506179 RepID=A0A9W9G9V1_9EURO|nr:uncharacterized protein NUU61_000517 [Penicillium alfredii]KAJ5114758.1 hypothetical protein NUU61_000517 [Penicillium alfredii]